MRRPAIGLLLAALPAFLTGCAQHQRFGSDPPIQYPASHTVDPPFQAGGYGGVLSGAFLSDPKTFNVWVADDADSAGIVGNLYDTLEGRDAFSLNYTPRLAYLPKISPDGLTYTYTLRPGLKWSDGYPITADDVIFSLGVIFDPKIECPFRENMLIDVKQPDGTTKHEPFQYKKLDDRTVQFTLPVKWAPAQEVFGFNIAPKHILEPIYKAGKFNSAWGIDTPPSQLVSSGPLIMTEFVPQQRIVFKRNPYFWGNGPNNQKMPYLDQFQYVITPDTNAMVLTFRSGDCEAVDVPLQQYPSTARYAKRDNYTVIDRGADWGFAYLAFNMNPSSTMSRTPALLKLFQDKRFRQACSYAINRQTLCDSASLGLAHPLWGPETPADVLYYDPKVRQYPYNPALAKQMLQDIGCRPGPNGILQYDGQPIKFNILTNTENAVRKANATIIMNSLRNIGMDVSFTPVQFNDLIRRLDAKPYDWQASVMGFTGGSEPNDGSAIWRSAGQYHQWNPQQTKPATDWEARIDTDFTNGAHEIDPKKRKLYYNDWQETLGEEEPFVFLDYQEDYTALRNHYGNIRPSPLYSLGGSVYWNIEQIYDTHAHKPTP